MEEEFDLLAGHDLGESNALPQNDVDPEMVNILVWHKLETKGFQPPAREGHSAVTSGMSVYVFGGFQAGMRTNTVLSLNVITGSWSVVNCTGNIPASRSFHAACSVDNYMFIHGGECQIDPTNTSQPSAQPEDNTVLISALSTSGVEGKQTVKSASIVDSSVWTSNVEEDPEAVAMDGVCPGDTIGFQRNLPTVLQGSDIAVGEHKARLCCSDDFYVLDTMTREWNKISCILAPLPRKGHSMVVANIDDKPHIVIFGGYSSDNQTLSNSIHVCEVSKVLQHYKNCQSNANSNSISRIKALRQQETLNKPVVFRTLNCKGTPPAPRYRHSCTIVSGGGEGETSGQNPEQFMVIVGGIGKDVNVSLCDVHVLNLNTLTWLNVPSDALEKGHAGEGPSTGIYGHTAFAVPSAAASLPVVSAGAIENAIPVELMVYGGSSNAASGKSNCNRHIYGLDLMTHNWRRIRTGFAFPSARNNHSAAVIYGWAPSNTLPSSHLGSSVGGASSAVVVFGGVNSVMCASDTWALDLKWRPPGVDAYDGNINEKVDEEVLHQVTQKRATPIEQQFLKASGVTNLISPDTVSSVNRSNIQAVNDEKYMSMIKTSGSSGALRKSSKLPPSGKHRHASSSNRNQHHDESEEDLEDDEDARILKVSASDPNFHETLQTAKFQQSKKSAGSRSYDFLGTANEQLNRELLHSTMMLATSETAGSEEQQVGHAFLKIRKERAQADILLKQETSRAVQAETANAQLRAEFDTFQAAAAAEKDTLLSEIAELKLQLERSYEREKQLQILNEEAYDLLILGGIKQL